MPGREYRVTVRIRPDRRLGQQYDDPGYVEKTYECLKSFTDHFDSETISIEWTPVEQSRKEYPFVDDIIAFFETKQSALKVGSWMADGPTSFTNQRGWTIEGSASPESILRARWVHVSSDFDQIEDDGQRPIRCQACGWRDFDAVPQTFLAEKAAKDRKRDLFLTQCGLMVVTERVLPVLHEACPDEFDTGEIALARKGKDTKRLFWVRPRARIGNLVYHQALGERCKVCGLPDELRQVSEDPAAPGVETVVSYGDTNANIAIIGDVPQSAKRVVGSDPTIWRELALSGGLFARLYNAGFKGLEWPTGGPLISMVPEQPTWEPTPRLVDPSSTVDAERIMKVKVPDWS